MATWCHSPSSTIGSYLLSSWLNYGVEDMAGHVHDYGTKFLVAAGLMNVLAIVDAYEIAVGKRT